jgi:outer membrane protein assembly factor BamB/tetratricopeptide (TPR) repeat protein
MSWSSRRAIFVLGAVAVFGMASVVQHVHAQRRIARPIRRPPPGVVVPGGPEGVPGGPGTKPPAKGELGMGNLTLTADDGPLTGRIQAAGDNIVKAMRATKRKELNEANKYWEAAVKTLQELRSREQDKFVTVTRKDVEGHEVSAYVSVKTEAARLIGRLPKPGRDFYEGTYGRKADSMVKHAKDANDPREMGIAMSLYLYTEAGAEAANWLGTYFLDRGNYQAATNCFAQLLQRDGVAALSGKTLIKSALAFHHGGGEKSRLEAIAAELKKRGKELKFRDEPRTPEEVLTYINKRPTHTVTLSASDVPGYRGGDNRNVLQPGGVPLLHSLWREETVTKDKDGKKPTLPHLQQAERQLLGQDKPVLPASFPVTTTVERKGKKTSLVAFRNWNGIVAVDLKTGKVAWKQDSDWGLDSVLSGTDARKSQALNQWIQYFNQTTPMGGGGRPQILFENSVLGTLSANGKYLYAIEDLPVPPPNYTAMGGRFPPPGGGGMPGGGVWGSEVNDAINCNKLLIIEAASGSLKQELGGPGVKGELADTYFLGAPLAVGDRLYVLTEKQEELRLMTLSATTGKILGFQALAHTKDTRLSNDPLRRTEAAHLSYGEGILVIPTNAGAVFGFDVLANSLVWAYPYHENAGAKKPAPGGPGMPGGGRWVPPGPGGMMVNPLADTHWQVTAPVVQDGKVVFTAPDARSVHCVNLRDGTPAWSQPRRSDDLYLAGVFNGKVVIVGKKTTRAINLAKGDTVWELEVGLPSGQGAASALKPGEPGDLIYYLPLKKAALSGEPEVCAINVDKGVVHAHTKSRKKDVPGNLLFHEGEMISQTMTEVVAYPQLEVKLAELDAKVKDKPNDPDVLTERGDYLLDKGDLKSAIDDFRKALANKPADATRAKAKAKTYEALTELFQRDFDSAERAGFVKLYEQMCKVDTPGLGEAERAAEERRRRANFLCLVGKGKEAQGKLLEAFEKYLELGAGARPNEMIQVVDEPSVRAAPDVWSGGRIAAMVANPKDPEAGKRVEAEVARRWKKINASEKPDLAELRKFVKVFGHTFDVGKQARMALAERLMEDTDLNSLLEAEQHLQVLRGPGEAPEVAARAVEALARLNTRKGLLDDAAYYYDLLGKKYAKVRITVGGKTRTGAEFQEDLATDKRFWPYLDQPVGFTVPKGYKVKGTEDKSPSSSTPSEHVYHFAHDGEDLPFFARNQVGLKTGSNQLRLVDGGTGEERWSLPLKQTQFAQLSQPRDPTTNKDLSNLVRFSYQTLGHTVVIQLGHMVFGVDPLNKGRVLWEKDLYTGPAGTGPTFAAQPTVDAKDNAVVVQYADNWVQRLGQAGPLQGGVVCLLSRDELRAVDPVTGRTLWARSDINSRSSIFGDDQYLYVVNLDNEGNATSTRALRAHDGVSVRVREFAKAYQKRARMLGRNILVADTDDKTNALTLRIYDVLAGKDLWREKFGPGAVLLRSEDPRLAGAVEKNGQVRVVDLVTQKEVLNAKMDPAHLNKAQEVHLVADKDFVYLAVNGPPDPNLVPWGGGLQSNLQPGVGLRSVPVSGQVYCFHRATGKLNWHEEAINQMMVVSQFEDMPVVLFTARYMKWVGALPARTQTNVATGLAREKRTGKLVWESESVPSGMYFHALNLDTRGKKAELIGAQLKVTFELVRKP